MILRCYIWMNLSLEMWTFFSALSLPGLWCSVLYQYRDYIHPTPTYPSSQPVHPPLTHHHIPPPPNSASVSFPPTLYYVHLVPSFDSQSLQERSSCISVQSQSAVDVLSSETCWHYLVSKLEQSCCVCFTSWIWDVFVVNTLLVLCDYGRGARTGRPEIGA